MEPGALGHQHLLLGSAQGLRGPHGHLYDSFLFVAAVILAQLRKDSQVSFLKECHCELAGGGIGLGSADFPVASMQGPWAGDLVSGCLQGLCRPSQSEAGQAEAGWVVLGPGSLAFLLAVWVLWASPRPSLSLLQSP